MTWVLDDASIVRLEEARDRKRYGQRSAQPAVPATPEPAPQPNTPPPPPPPRPPVLAGSVVLSAGEWQAVQHLIDTHPQTRSTYRSTGETF